jgi:trehalose 6-phosphate phosphatase
MSAGDVRAAADAVRHGADGRHLLFLSDFDGTLADFDPDPAAVVLPESRRGLLNAIGSQPYVTVGLVSGRRLADVRDRAHLSIDACYAGLHGLEIDCDGERFLHPAVEASRSLLQDLAASIGSAIASVPGAFVENKGLSMAAHFREASAADASRVIAIVERQAAPHVESGVLRIMRGACLIELLPDIDWHKGSAIDWIYRRIAERRGALFAVYMGDDVTDEDAFRVLRGRGISMAASDRVSGADFTLEGPPEIEALLRELAPPRA